MEQSPPREQPAGESSDEEFHEPSVRTPQVNRTRTRSDLLRNYGPDVNLSESRDKTVPPNTPQGSSQNVDSGTPYFEVCRGATPKPQTSTPQRQPKATSSIPKPTTRRIFRTASTAETPATDPAQPSSSRIPSGAIPKKTTRELKKLETFNKRGKSEEDPEDLPSKRRQRAKIFD